MIFLRKAWKWIRTHKKITIPLFIVLIILVLIFRPRPPKPIATTSVHPTTVTQVVSVSGTVAAKKSINLTFPIGGTIAWIGVQKGDTVTAGQTIATLDQRTVLKNLQTALNNYRSTRDTFDQTIQNSQNQDVLLNEQQKSLTTAGSGIGQYGTDASSTNYINDAIKRILDQNQASLDNAVINVELQDLARQQAVLSTPISGLVTRADAQNAGVTATAATVFTITDPTSIVFDMDVDEADVSKIDTSQTAKIVLDAYPNATLSLPVTSIDFVSHTTSSGGSAYTVEAKIPNNTNYRYRVGMNGNADIVTAQRTHVLSVPLSAITDDNAVYVQKGKKFVKTKITVGLQSDTDAEVTAGLQSGDVVALDPNSVITNKLVASK